MLSAIVAFDRNLAIGLGNKLPWRLPTDLANFKNKTLGSHLIVGRKTYESIGKPLPKRTSIVLTSNADYSAPGSLVANSIDEALELCPSDQETFVIGGGEIYKSFLPHTDIIYATSVKTEIKNADSHFPKIDPKDWLLLREESPQKSDRDEHDFVYQVFLRRSKVV